MKQLALFRRLPTILVLALLTAAPALATVDEETPILMTGGGRSGVMSDQAPVSLLSWIAHFVRWII